MKRYIIVKSNNKTIIKNINVIKIPFIKFYCKIKNYELIIFKKGEI